MLLGLAIAGCALGSLHTLDSGGTNTRHTPEVPADWWAGDLAHGNQAFWRRL